MRELCLKCFRPVENCFCRYIRPVESGIKFIFLMHPKEFKKQKTGTGRLAHLTLPESEIIVGIDFTKDRRVCELLNDPQYYPVLLYPGNDAWTADKQGFSEAIGEKKLLVFVIDSTWFCSHKMIRYSTNLLALPKLSFKGAYRSIFTFKREPKEEYISTIESCYYLIKEMQTAKIISPKVDTEPLMDVFKEMIKFQLNKENDRIEGRIPNSHASDWKYTRKKEIPDF